MPPTPTKSSNLSETAEVPACNVPSRSPLPALAIAPETKLGRSEERFSRNAETDLDTLSLHDALPISNQIKQLIRNGRSASLQRTFKKSFTSFSHSTRNKTRDGLIRVRNIRALNGRFNTSITH